MSGIVDNCAQYSTRHDNSNRKYTIGEKIYTNVKVSITNMSCSI